MCAHNQNLMMNFKPKRYWAAFLLCMVATAGSKPAADPTRLTGGLYHPANRRGPRRFHLSGRTSRSLGDTDADITGRIRGPPMSSGESGHNRETMRRMSVSPRPARGDCIAGEVEAVTPGRIFISGQLEVISPNVGYQADSAFPGEMDLFFSPSNYCYIYVICSISDAVKFPVCSVEYFLFK